MSISSMKNKIETIPVFECNSFEGANGHESAKTKGTKSIEESEPTEPKCDLPSSRI
jgi:hypothetical protein